jgi:hypothetical protein
MPVTGTHIKVMPQTYLGIAGFSGSTVLNGFAGVLGEVRISRTARYDKDFTPQMRFEPDTDTLALYHMDEGAGDKLTDSSGNGHHGTIIGARWVKGDGTPVERK